MSNVDQRLTNAAIVSLRIKRTSAIIRKEFLTRNTEKALCLRQKALMYAALDTEAVSDAAFRTMYVQSEFGNMDGSGIFPSNETIAELLDRSISSVKRANAEMVSAGYQITRRRRNAPSIRMLAIPRNAMDRIVSEVSVSTHKVAKNKNTLFEKGQIWAPEGSDLTPYPTPLTYTIRSSAKGSSGWERRAAGKKSNLQPLVNIEVLS